MSRSRRGVVSVSLDHETVRRPPVPPPDPSVRGVSPYLPGTDARSVYRKILPYGPREVGPVHLSWNTTPPLPRRSGREDRDSGKSNPGGDRETANVGPRRVGPGRTVGGGPSPDTPGGWVHGHSTDTHNDPPTVAVATGFSVNPTKVSTTVRP